MLAQAVNDNYVSLTPAGQYLELAFTFRSIRERVRRIRGLLAAERMHNRLGS
jgi:hypothetical protein